MDTQLDTYAFARVWAETLQTEIDWCDALCDPDDPCYHCRQKQTAISVACGWAMDLGMRLAPLMVPVIDVPPGSQQPNTRG